MATGSSHRSKELVVCEVRAGKSRPREAALLKGGTEQESALSVYAEGLVGDDASEVESGRDLEN